MAKEARSSLQDVCDEYGLVVGDRMAWTHAQVYQGPLLEFGQGKTITPEQSDREKKGGNVNIRNSRFFKPAKIGNFLIINCSRANKQSIDTMAGALQKIGGNFGMEFGGWKIEQEFGLIS